MKNMLGPKTRPIVAFTLAAFGLIIIGAALAGPDDLGQNPGDNGRIPIGTNGGGAGGFKNCLMDASCPARETPCGGTDKAWCCPPSTPTPSGHKVCKCYPIAGTPPQGCVDP